MSNSPRELELEMATNRPFFSGAPVKMADPSELYPNVYDSMAKAKLTSAYVNERSVRNISNQKLMLSYISVVDS